MIKLGWNLFFNVCELFLGLEEEPMHSFGDYNIHGEIAEQVGIETDNEEDLANPQVTYTDLKQLIIQL
jgi:hypothetical protein